MALAFATLVGGFTAAPMLGDHATVYARRPRPLRTPLRAPPAAAPAEEVKACAGNSDPKLAVTEKCTPNSGDTAWMLTSTRSC